jgi:hypothetical protein
MTYLSSVIIDFFGREVKDRSSVINITWKQKHRSLGQWKIYGVILRCVLRFVCVCVCVCVCVWSKKKEVKFPVMQQKNLCVRTEHLFQNVEATIMHTGIKGAGN